GLVTLSGSNTFYMQGTRLTLQSNSISGAGSIWKVGSGILEFAGTNSYTGNTTISNGVVALIGNTSLTNSPILNLANGTNTTPIIDVTNRTDGTLTLISGQTLKGSGIIRGTLVVSA